MNQFLNVYDNIRTPQIKNTSTIEQWFQLIQKSEYSDIILQARKFGKEHIMYDALKATVPAITYNFTFKENKNNANITGATGLLYIDVDDSTFDITSLDLTKVFACYRSFGGVGYSILVQVNNLTLDNYTSTYEAIIADLGLTQYYDKNAAKATQFNVLSYDPNLHINFTSFIYDSICFTNELEIPPRLSIIKEKKIYKDREGGKIDFSNSLRNDNLNEIEFEGNYSFNWDGWSYVNAWLPFKRIQPGKRNSTLLGFLNNYVWLNPQLTQKGAATILTRINESKCEEPLTPSEVKSIVRSIFKYKEAGTLKPIINFNTRKIIFSRDSGLTREEKLAICRVLLAERKTNESLQKLSDIITGWDFEKFGKIGQTIIHKNFPVSKKTVEKYWPEFRDEVKLLNESFKNAPAMKAKGLSMTEGHLEPAQSEIKPVEPLNPVNELPVSDLVKDESGGYFVANYSEYQTSIKSLGNTPQVMMKYRLTQLLKTGFQGEETINAGDFAYQFAIHPAANTIEFKKAA